MSSDAPSGKPATTDSAAASLTNAVASLVEALIANSALPHSAIADAMGVTPARVSQLLSSDGNLRVASLGRLAAACESGLTLTATLRSTGESVTVPRPVTRTRRSGTRADHSSVPNPASDSAENAQERTSLAAAALINATGSLMEQVVDLSGRTRSEIATAMGVTRGRVTQILDGDGNVRFATLARVMEAAGADLRLTATRQQDGLSYSVPRDLTRVRPTRPGARGGRVAAAPCSRAQSASAVRARVRELVPVRELVKRGILPSDTAGHPQAVCDLLEITDLWDEAPFLAAARRHNASEAATDHQRAWLACARAQSRSIEVPSLNEAALRHLAKGLTRDLIDPSAFANLPARFATVGIRLVHVEQFPGGKISGVAFRLGAGDPSATIALSGRGQRLDKVLFTLLHECAHIVLGHIRDGGIILDTDSITGDEREKAADALAATWALAEPLYAPRTVTATWVEAEARRRGIHPIIILGRLQSSGELSWQSHLSRGAPTVIDQLRMWSAVQPRA